MDAEDFESWHYLSEYGKLLSMEGVLVSLPDVVRLRMHVDPLPMGPAGRMVLDKLDSNEGVPLYVTRRTEFAAMVRESFVWRSAKGEAPEVRGRSGLLSALRAAWSNETATEQSLYDTAFGGQTALLASDAVRIGLVSDGRDLGSGRGTTVVNPVGATWLHVAGLWTNAERDAAFEMRHLHGVSDAVLVDVVGVTRQAINAQIGATKAPQTNRWPDSLAWRPSDTLLKKCGFCTTTVKALQNWPPRNSAAAR
jgi:hypothetical protein